MDLQQQINNSLEYTAHILRVEWPSLRDELLTAPSGSPEQAELRKKAIGLWWGYQTHQACLRGFRRSEADQEIENFLKELLV